MAAWEGTTAREIDTKLLIGNFNGLPVINSSIKVIGIVTAVDILRAIRQKIKEISEYDRDNPPRISKKEFSLMRLNVAIGMALSQLIMWSVITTTAVSLHNHGITDIQTADQAARALQPLVSTFPYAGVMAKTIFALGHNWYWMIGDTCHGCNICICPL